jgi:hypothetical protein
MDKLVLTKLQEMLIEMRKQTVIQAESVEPIEIIITQQMIEEALSQSTTALLAFSARLISDKEIAKGLNDIAFEHVNRAFIKSCVGVNDNCDLFSDINRDTLIYVTKSAVQAKAA